MREKPKILIADDDRDLVEILSGYIEMNGYDTVTAHEGVRALELAHKVKPDLIVLDIQMPAGNGVYVLKNLKVHWETKNIPVIVITGLNDPNLKKQIEKMGANDFIPKPYESSELLLRIRRLLSGEGEKEEDTLRLWETR